MAMKRLFLAFRPSRKITEALESIRTHQLAPSLPLSSSVRWPPKKNLHLTLHFLGKVSQDIETELIAKIENLKLPPRTLQTFNRLGAFPSNEKGRIFVLEGKPTTETLADTYLQMINIIKELGIPIEKRPFRPHITLARSKSPLSFRPPKLNDTLEYPLTALSLYESVLSPEGAQYRVLREFPLADSQTP